MSTSDRFGWAALLMTPIGVAIAILWPTQRWLGWTLLGFAGLLAAIWIVKELRLKFGNNAIFPTLELLVCFCAILFIIWASAYPTSARGEFAQQPSHDPPFVAPKGPGIRVEMSAPVASNQLCIGLPEKDETQCLCPRPVEFSLKPLPAPNDNNYATEVTITAGREPMYRVRLFARSQIHPGGELWASPHGKESAALFTGVMAYDLSSIYLRSSAPEQEFKLELHSAEGLRIKCVNQEN
jgi:hypothetical protein